MRMVSSCAFLLSPVNVADPMLAVLKWICRFDSRAPILSFVPRLELYAADATSASSSLQSRVCLYSITTNDVQVTILTHLSKHDCFFLTPLRRFCLSRQARVLHLQKFKSSHCRVLHQRKICLQSPPPFVSLLRTHHVDSFVCLSHFVVHDLLQTSSRTTGSSSTTSFTDTVSNGSMSACAVFVFFFFLIALTIIILKK